MTKFKQWMSPVRRAGIIAAFIYASNVAAAQTKTEVLTNKSVTELVKAGLDKSIILTTIKNADAKFDVSATGLVALKNAKIDNDIIAAMVTKANSGNEALAANSGKSSAAASSKAELLNHPYYNNMPLDKATGSVATKVRGLGYGGANSQYEVDGDRAKFRISKGDDISFIVNTGDEAPKLALYKGEVKKGKRTVLLASVRMFSGAKTGGNSISVSMSSLGNGVYKIVPSEVLEAGEYFFITRDVGTSASIDDAFAFGIDE